MEQAGQNGFQTSDSIKGLLGELSALTGLSLSVIDLDGRFLVNPTKPTRLCTEIIHPRHLGKCQACDAEHLKRAVESGRCEPYRCWTGLLNDFVAPLKVDGSVVAGFFAGQVLERAPSEAEIAALAERIGIPEQLEAVRQAVGEVPVVSHANLEWACRCLTVAAKALEQKLVAEGHARRMQALQAAIAAVAGHRNLVKVLNTVVERAGEVVPCDGACLWMLDDATHVLKAEVAVGPFADELLDKEAIPGLGCVRWVARKRRPLLITNIRGGRRAGLRFPDLISQGAELRSLLGVPLLFHEELLGVLGVASRRANAYTNADAEVLSAFGNRVAQAIVNARPYEQERHRLLVSSLAQVRATAPNFEAFLDSAVRLIGVTSVSPSCTLWLAEERTGNLVLRAAYGPQERFIGKHQFAPDEGIAGFVARTGEAVRVRIGSGHAAWKGKHEKEVYGQVQAGRRPILCVPVRYGDKTLGVLGLSCPGETETRPNPWYGLSDEHGLRLAGEFLGATIASEKARRQTSRLSKDAGGELTREIELRGQTESLLANAAEILGVERTSIWVVDERRERVVLEAAVGAHRPFVGEHFYRLGEGGTGWVAQHGEPIIVQTRREANADQRLKGKYLETVYGAKGPGVPAMILPLTVGSETVGVIKFTQRRASSSQREAPFTEAEIVTASTIAAHAASAVKLARLSEERKQHLDQLEVIQGITARFASVLWSDGLGQELVRAAAAAVESETARLYVLDEKRGKLVLRASHGIGPFLGALPEYSLNEGITGHVTQTGVPVRGTRVELQALPAYLGKYDDLVAPFTLSGKLLSGLVVPVRGRTSAVGVLAFDNKIGEDNKAAKFTEQDQRIAEAFGAQIGLAIENAGLLAAQREPSILAELNSILTSTVDHAELRDRLCGAVADKAMQLPGAERANLRLVDPSTNELWFVVGRGPGWTPEVMAKRYRIGQDGIACRVAATGEARLVEDVSKCEDHLKVFDDVRCHLSVPIVRQAKTIGVVSIDSSKPGAFTEMHLEWLMRLSAEAAVALENVELFARAGLGRIEAMLSAQDLQGALPQIVREVPQLVGGETCSLFLWDGESQRLVLAATTGLEPQPTNPGPVFYELGKGLTGWIAKHCRPLRLANIADREELRQWGDDLTWTKEHREKVSHGELNARFLGVPVTLHEKLIGVLRVSGSPRDREFTPYDQQLLTVIASRLAAALERDRLAGELKERLEEVESLHKATLATVSAQDLGAQLETILKAATAITGAERGLMAAQDPRTGRIELVVPRGRKFIPPLAESAVQKALESRAPWVSGKLAEPRYFCAEWIGGRSTLVAPIEDALGALVLESPVGGDFEPKDVERLKPLVALATGVLHQRRAFLELAESEKMASLGLLAAGVAHELNTVLNNIGHCAENVPFESQGSERDRLLQGMRQEVERGGAIVRQLLALGHSAPAETKACDLGQVVTEVMELVKHQLELENIKVIERPSPQLATVVANEGHLKQVFLNIITNARQAMKGRGGILTVTTELNSPAGFVEVSFADTGPGMTEEQQRLAFEPFYTTKAPGQGTGLGLSICKRIVEDLGGEIRLDSELGTGTTCVVFLPLSTRKEE